MAFTPPNKCAPPTITVDQRQRCSTSVSKQVCSSQQADEKELLRRQSSPGSDHNEGILRLLQDTTFTLLWPAHDPSDSSGSLSISIWFRPPKRARSISEVCLSHWQSNYWSGSLATSARGLIVPTFIVVLNAWQFFVNPQTIFFFSILLYLVISLRLINFSLQRLPQVSCNLLLS